MRFLPVSLLCALLTSSVIAAPEENSEDPSDEVKPTIFNGVEVPPLLDIDGEKFNATIKEGYWFVKHHS